MTSTLDLPITSNILTTTTATATTTTTTAAAATVTATSIASTSLLSSTSSVIVTTDIPTETVNTTVTTDDDHNVVLEAVIPAAVGVMIVSLFPMIIGYCYWRSKRSHKRRRYRSESKSTFYKNLAILQLLINNHVSNRDL